MAEYVSPTDVIEETTEETWFADPLRLLTGLETVGEKLWQLSDKHMPKDQFAAAYRDDRITMFTH